jgi:DNA-directed RNA polymerase specialized sigma24 family protein
VIERKRDAGRRNYRPVVEGLEALRLLASVPPSFAEIVGAIEADPTGAVLPGSMEFSGAAWDVALDRSRVAELISAPAADLALTPALDPHAVESGLSQLDRYLARTWYRSGIDPQKHEDCTQAVYTSLLQQFGRERFDRMLEEIGLAGIREIFSRETADGPDFFRTVDAVKKRAQRERSHQSIDRVDVADEFGSTREELDRRAALLEAISRSLSRREAELINETLLGRTPAEIAQVWGVAPKTVSNEKAKALQKLREVLTAASLN